MRKKLMILGIVLIVVLVYVCLVCLPYKNQGAVMEKTTSEFALEDFYGEKAGGERAAILFDNEEALAERIRLISHATDRIILSTFDFKSDNSGKQMLSALYHAAGRGVEVQILVDGFSYFNSIMGDVYFKILGSMEHVTMKVYNPINPLKPTKLMARLHDKYLIVDDKAYILGGRNTYDYFLGDDTDYKNYDWDMLIFSEQDSEKSSLNKLQEYFQDIWELEECKIVMDQPSHLTFPVKKREEVSKELEQIYGKMKQEKAEWFEEIDYVENTVETNRITLLMNPIHASVKEPVLFYMMTELMLQAEGEVRFHTPYVLCNDYMMKRLEQVCASEKTVYMMTNSVANNGNPFGAVDYSIHKEEILDAGVKILEYDQGVSYHGKCFTIGDRLSAIGSFNWDMRSAYIDTEIMLVADSPELNEIMKKYMSSYEKDALTVENESSYILKEGQTPRKISEKRKNRIQLLKPFDKPFRFLF